MKNLQNKISISNDFNFKLDFYYTYVMYIYEFGVKRFLGDVKFLEENFLS